MEADRNQPCSCGSGKKFKNCCANKREASSAWLVGACVLIFGIVGAWAVTASFRGDSEGDALPGGDVIDGDAGTLAALGGEDRPPIPAPPGKVWSPEHGHWHHLEPEGPAPPGKVWSPEHGHWHDATGQAESIGPGPGESPLKWIADHGHYHEWSDEHGHWHEPGQTD